MNENEILNKNKKIYEAVDLFNGYFEGSNGPFQKRKAYITDEFMMVLREGVAFARLSQIFTARE